MKSNIYKLLSVCFFIDSLNVLNEYYGNECFGRINFIKENQMKSIDVVAAVVVVIGALNWGVFGLLGVDLVSALFGDASVASRFVYILVGFAGLFQAAQWKSIQRRWQHA